MQKGIRIRWWSLIILLGLWACEPASGFRKIDPADSGISFSNDLRPEVAFSILDYPYFYNGGGVGVADFDQDGLLDLYFTANQGENKLYKNLGDWSFQDMTEVSGTGGSQEEWSTGVSIADINADGLPDLYVSTISGELGREGVNRLYLNRGDFQFEESAEVWGLDIRGMCTQAAFFDADHDGDLDCYVLKHSVRPAEVVRDTSLRNQRDPWAGDQLLINQDGVFTDMSEKAGISGSRLGYGLNVLINDWTGDGWPDIYVCNDFQEDDYFYVNNGDGTFTNRLTEYFDHTSRFSMGSDFADLNQDGIADILSLDMKPDREDILKTAEAPESYDAYQYKRSFGYHHQFPRNALQLSGFNSRFSEHSQLAGIDATDWSWGALFGDLDLDGKEDLFITNGIFRRPNDMDYIKFLSEPGIKRELGKAPSQAQLRFIEKMPSIPLANPVFQQQPGMIFNEVTQEWGLDELTFSNGLALADLDRDGDLDIITNNLNARAGIFENRIRKEPSFATVRVKLHQEGKNPEAIGSQITVVEGQFRYTRFIHPVRGFLSSQPAEALVAIPPAMVDSIYVRWPDGEQTVWTPHNRAGHEIMIHRSETTPVSAPQMKPSEIIFSVDTISGFHHEEDVYVDMNPEPLIPHMLSKEGPALAVSNDWVFFGGGTGQAGVISRVNEIDRPVQLIGTERKADDVDAIFVDLTGDQQEELVVVRGGNRSDISPSHIVYHYAEGEWQVLQTLGSSNAAVVEALDANKDGLMDLWIGARSVPGSYGTNPVSELWINESGTFSEKAEEFGLDDLGMITDAELLDWDGDGQEELITVGEWEKIRVWSVTEGRANEILVPILGQSEGWWNHVKAMDIDGDGDKDLLAGNLGWNSDLEASVESPCYLYLDDFDGNGATDPIICRTRGGRQLPWASRDELLGQLTFLRRKYISYASYANQSITDILGEEKLAQATVKSVRTFSSVWIENKGEEGWRLHELPWQAQAFPVYASACIAGPSGPVLLLAGNQFEVGPKRGRYDAGHGLALSIQSNDADVFRISGWNLRGLQIRNMQELPNRSQLLALPNQEQPQIWTYSGQMQSDP